MKAIHLLVQLFHFSLEKIHTIANTCIRLQALEKWSVSWHGLFGRISYLFVFSNILSYRYINVCRTIFLHSSIFTIIYHSKLLSNYKQEFLSSSSPPSKAVSFNLLHRLLLHQLYGIRCRLMSNHFVSNKTYDDVADVDDEDDDDDAVGAYTIKHK